MLPVINEDTINSILPDVTKDIHGWRKKMIHYIKNENPEVNTAIIEIAQNSELDPKAVATGAYLTYLLLEQAAREEENAIEFEE